MNTTTKYAVPVNQCRIIDRNHFLSYYVATQNKTRSDSQWRQQNVQTIEAVF